MAFLITSKRPSCFPHSYPSLTLISGNKQEAANMPSFPVLLVFELSVVNICTQPGFSTIVCGHHADGSHESLKRTPFHLVAPFRGWGRVLFGKAELLCSWQQLRRHRRNVHGVISRAHVFLWRSNVPTIASRAWCRKLAVLFAHSCTGRRISLIQPCCRCSEADISQKIQAFTCRLFPHKVGWSRTLQGQRSTSLDCSRSIGTNWKSASDFNDTTLWMNPGALENFRKLNF
mmetsp:Transcript_52245/g.162250  ORF Transcript_52245/g.162250 Transcript_52245/m.162250 type:complete len:231 (+) Transcript_52245:1645-2337(+)